MFPSLIVWDIASLVSKLMWYLAVICVAGGSFSLWLIADDSRRFLTRNLNYILIGSVLGFHGALVYFLVQVGAANDNSVAGMFDWAMISFFLNTSVGEASLLRLMTFFVLIVVQLIAMSHQSKLTKPPTLQFFRLLLRFNGISLLALCLSFQVTGHVAPLTFLPRLALVLHVLAVSLWIGTLYPLRRATFDYEIDQLQFIMRRFGHHATIIVGVLLVAAGFMVYQLLASPVELIDSPYGISLVIKSLFVCCLLGLAALNRWALVGNLGNTGVRSKLRRSITFEMVAAALILVVTVFLSTVVGPEHSA